MYRHVKNVPAEQKSKKVTKTVPNETNEFWLPELKIGKDKVVVMTNNTQKKTIKTKTLNERMIVKSKHKKTYIRSNQVSRREFEYGGKYFEH